MLLSLICGVLEEEISLENFVTSGQIVYWLVLWLAVFVTCPIASAAVCNAFSYAPIVEVTGGQTCKHTIRTGSGVACRSIVLQQRV